MKKRKKEIKEIKEMKKTTTEGGGSFVGCFCWECFAEEFKGGRRVVGGQSRVVEALAECFVVVGGSLVGAAACFVGGGCLVGGAAYVGGGCLAALSFEQGCIGVGDSVAFMGLSAAFARKDSSSGVWGGAAWFAGVEAYI